MKTISRILTVLSLLGIAAGFTGCQKDIAPEPPVAAFSSDVQTIKIGDEVTFKDESTGATGWAWHFGDGMMSKEQNPVHRYNEIGTYTVKLIANNGYEGSVLVKENYITVTEYPPIPVDFEASMTDVKEREEITFTPKVEDPASITSWYWDFGNGKNSTKQNPTISYDEIGKYTVSLKVKTEYAEGSVEKAEYISVRKSLVPVAGISIGNPTAQINTEIQFNDASENAAEWAWDFGDGTSSTEQNPKHKYTIPGMYTVSLTVKSQDGEDSKTIENAVTAYGKKADGYVLTYEVLISTDNAEHLLGIDQTGAETGVPQFTGTVYYGEKSIELANAKALHLTFDKAGKYLISLKGQWKDENQRLCPMNNEIVRLVHAADLKGYTGNWRAQKPTGLKSIEPGFFDECPDLNSLENAFFGAGKLTVIPADLLAKLPKLIKANSAFRETGIESVPAGLFDNNPELETLDYAFNNSPNLTTIPSGLFKNNKKLKVTAGAFKECRKLTSDISALFSEPCASLENVKNMFNGCPELTGNAQKIWDTAIFTNPKLQDPDPHAECFRGCSKLSNYKDIPDSWKGIK